MDFARSQLLKYGWKDGQGLGKNETGMKDHVKVKLKMDKTGVGHDAGQEFTNHWWDNVFNKTAKSIQVSNTQDGVTIKKTSKHEKEISKNLQTYSKKATTYGNFVRKATLSNGCEEDEIEVHTEEAVVTDNDNSAVAPNYCLIPENEDEIFLKCGGRTAHKGARHGLKLNGKLQRIQEQEQLLLDKWKSQSTNQSDSNKLGVDSEKVDNAKDCEDDTKHGTKRKKKKKKSKHVDKDVEVEITNEEDVEENSDIVRKKKKRKNKEDLLDETDTVKVSVDETALCSENVEVSKKKKKKKKRKE